MAFRFGLVVIAATDIDRPNPANCLKAKIISVFQHATLEVMIPAGAGPDGQGTRFIKQAGVQVIFLKTSFTDIQIAIRDRPDEALIEVPIQSRSRRPEIIPHVHATAEEGEIVACGDVDGKRFRRASMSPEAQAGTWCARLKGDGGSRFGAGGGNAGAGLQAGGLHQGKQAGRNDFRACRHHSGIWDGFFGWGIGGCHVDVELEQGGVK